jgi:hypothetical protein
VMLNENAQGLRLNGKTHSRDAGQTMSRRGSARRTVPHDVGTRPALLDTFTVGRVRNAADAVAPSILSRASVDSDELARAVADIEIASAALRQSEPTLEPWRPEAQARGAERYLPVWVLIGAVWITAFLALSGATGAILYLAG